MMLSQPKAFQGNGIVSEVEIADGLSLPFVLGQIVVSIWVFVLVPTVNF